MVSRVTRAQRQALLKVLSREWREFTACRPSDTARLDTIDDDRPSPAERQARLDERTKAAWELCWPCPVRAECSAEADLLEEVGVRGGVLRDHKKGGAYTRLDLFASDPEEVLAS